MIRGFVAAVLCAGSLLAADSAKTAFDKATLEAYLRHMLPFSPQVKMEIGDPQPSAVQGLKKITVRYTYREFSETSTLYVSNDGQHILSGDVFNIAKSPFQAQLDKLTTAGAPSFGPADAPVTLVVFGDFECPLCKEEAKAMRANIPKDYPKQVRVVFKDFPLVQIHPWAMTAAVAGRCIYQEKPAAFWDYYDWIYDHQSEITPDNVKSKIGEFAGAHNLQSMEFGRCVDTQATQKEVEASLAEGKTIPGLVMAGQRMNGVDSTPTTYINGLPVVGNVPWDSLKALIDKELDYQKTAKQQAEKCCEVGIPSALKQ